jgi:membrane protein implicated in regulation of membrane protease activity
VNFQFLSIWDLLITPFYLIILVVLAKRHRDKRYPKGHPLHDYYLKGLYLKYAGAIFIALVYQYVYGNGGDTFYFFDHARTINSALNESFSVWLNLMKHTPVDQDPRLYNYVSQMMWYDDSSSYVIARIAAVLGLLNGTSYIPISLLMAHFTYSGVVAMYNTFLRVYPTLGKKLILAFLFIPTTIAWGSAIFKDTVCMFALGWLTYSTFRIFVNKDFSFRNMFLLAGAVYLLAIIKIYILLSFVPALAIWLLLTYSHRIKATGLRWMVNILFFSLSIFSFLWFSQKFASELDKYSLKNIAKTSAITRGWIGYVSEAEEGSGYDLGDFDPSIGGMISKFPQAVVVTLFRPFIWEVKKPLVALSALESLAFLYFTLRLFFRNGFKVFRWIGKDPNLIFFLIFSLIFAFAVGISTGNFGTLSRYKIPVMPFYAALLIVLYQYDALEHEKSKKRFEQTQPGKLSIQPI